MADVSKSVSYSAVGGSSNGSGRGVVGSPQHHSHHSGSNGGFSRYQIARLVGAFGLSIVCAGIFISAVSIMGGGTTSSGGGGNGGGLLSSVFGGVDDAPSPPSTMASASSAATSADDTSGGTKRQNREKKKGSDGDGEKVVSADDDAADSDQRKKKKTPNEKKKTRASRADDGDGDSLISDDSGGEGEAVAKKKTDEESTSMDAKKSKAKRDADATDGDNGARNGDAKGAESDGAAVWGKGRKGTKKEEVDEEGLTGASLEPPPTTPNKKNINKRKRKKRKGPPIPIAPAGKYVTLTEDYPAHAYGDGDAPDHATALFEAIPEFGDDEEELRAAAAIRRSEEEEMRRKEEDSSDGGARGDGEKEKEAPAARTSPSAPTSIPQQGEPLYDPLAHDPRYGRPEEANTLAKQGSIWNILSTHYTNAPIAALLADDAGDDDDRDFEGASSSSFSNGKKDNSNGGGRSWRGSAMCLISAMYTGNCWYLDESFDDCVRRVGFGALETVLSEQCRQSVYWYVTWHTIGKHEEGIVPFDDDAARREEERLRKELAAATTLPPKTTIAAGKDGAASASLPTPTFGLDGDESELPSNTCTSADAKRSNTTNRKRTLRDVYSVNHYTSLRVKHGNSIASELCPTERAPLQPFIDPLDRVPAPFGEPRKCHNRALHYPIAFGTPSRNVQKRLFPKLFDFHPIPLDRKKKALKLNDEDTYQALAMLSYFCMTHSRGGWDCGRHYEVMGAGCVPYFYDIHAAGPYIVPQLPRKLLMDIVKKPYFSHIGHITGANFDTYHFADKTVKANAHVKFSVFNQRTRLMFYNESFSINRAAGFGWDPQWYWRTARRLLKYTRRYLTTEAMASYVLKTMGAEGARRILIMTRNEWDNLHQAVVTGLDGLGVEMVVNVERDRGNYNCVSFGSLGEEVPALTERDAAAMKVSRTTNMSALLVPTSARMCQARQIIGRKWVHGTGIPWANRIRGHRHVYSPELTDALLEEVAAGKFDAVIYTYFQFTDIPPHFLELRDGVKHKVAVMDHGDTTGDPHLESVSVAKKFFFFSRELRRSNC